MLQTIRAQAQKEFAEIERNIWIQEYVSRRENPVILTLYYLTLAICYFFSFRTYFTTGNTYSFLIHLAAFVALPIVFAILHSILNRIFKKPANRLCPVEAAPFDAANVPDSDALIERYNQMKKRRTKGFNNSNLVFLAPVILVLCYGYFAWLQQLPIPSGCVDYLVWQCVLIFFYGSAVAGLSSQSLDLPLSDAVKKELQLYEDGREKREKEAAERAEQTRLENERLAQQAEQRAQEAAEKAKRAAQANETYLNAIAQGNADESLLYQAAEMGSIEACRRIGQLMLERMASPMYTVDEKTECCENAAKYLRAFANSDDGELKYLLYYARSYFEKNNLEGWKALLNDLRALMASGTLPEQYVADCTALVQDLIRTVDNMAKKRAEREARPKHYRCRYCANGLCTLNSSSVTLIHCNYVTNPEYCPHNLGTHRYLEIVYDD